MSKKALITGASGGIGSAIALKLAKDGWDLILHYSQNEESARILAAQVIEAGRETVLFKANLKQQEEIDALAESANDVTAIVFAAGMSQYGMLQDVTDAEMDELWYVHMKAPMMISRKLIPSLLKQENASITFISSIWGETGASCETVYSAVKGAQIAFSKALAKELGPSGVRVNAISPGAVHTSMNSVFSAEEQGEIAFDIPLGRFAAPEEIANAAAFLVSPAASYITGHTLSVNGGWYA
ncbi:elongation factor P 5-aminopentanone reductase [Domibacillus epiphyticus]|uniref:3-oxoacyl-ACP reductase n=1 Tax=Domibacillus epiphyticus TaxID=1714355 RepID=A0A1V2ACD6_9BACI|nr:SDR family oxidoreductase [Domibacillus epiphyticus]OMP68658.1 3-oxoacyl-ACP reductase [Domibacillus epiphyticus]